MASNVSGNPSGLLEGLPEDIDQFSVVDEVRLIGGFIWQLLGRSVCRLILTFVTVFLASFLPAVLLILTLTLATQTYTRGVLLVVVVICLLAIAAMVGFNRVVYRGLRDAVEKLAFGEKIGAGLVAYIDRTDRMRLPLSEFMSKLKRYLSITREEAKAEQRGLKGLALRVVGRMVFFTAHIVLNRIAKGCVVDGEVDLERFATAIGEHADGLLISYFKKIIWDVTRVLLCIAVIVIWLVIIVVAQLSKLWA